MLSEPPGSSNRNPAPQRGVLLAIITVLLAISVGLVAGILAFWAGATILVALTAGGAAFVGAVTVTVAVLKLLNFKDPDRDDDR